MGDRWWPQLPTAMGHQRSEEGDCRHAPLRVEKIGGPPRGDLPLPGHSLSHGQGLCVLNLIPRP